MMSVRHCAKRALQLAGMIIAGVCVAVGVLIALDYRNAAWVPRARWVAFVPYTALIFGTLIIEFRTNWPRPLFWVSLAGLLAIHIGVYAVVLTQVREWRLAWYFPATMAEGSLMVALLVWMDFDGRAVARRRRRF